MAVERRRLMRAARRRKFRRGTRRGGGGGDVALSRLRWLDGRWGGGRERCLRLGERLHGRRDLLPQRAFVGIEAPGHAGSAGRRDQPREDRKSVVSGKRVSVRVDLGGGRCITKKNNKKQTKE